MRMYLSPVVASIHNDIYRSCCGECVSLVVIRVSFALCTSSLSTAFSRAHKKKSKQKEKKKKEEEDAFRCILHEKRPYVIFTTFLPNTLDLVRRVHSSIPPPPVDLARDSKKKKRTRPIHKRNEIGGDKSAASDLRFLRSRSVPESVLLTSLFVRLIFVLI